MTKNTIENLIQKAIKESMIKEGKKGDDSKTKTKVKEAEVTAGESNTMFNIKVDVSYLTIKYIIVNYKLIGFS